MILWGVPPLSAQERIVRFDVDAEIGTDASLTVTERITVMAEGKDIRRGIIRSIPTDFTDSEGRVRRAPLDLVSAFLDGKPTQAQVSRAGERLEFRLGDSGARLLVTDLENAAKVAPLQGRLPAPPWRRSPGR